MAEKKIRQFSKPELIILLERRRDQIQHFLYREHNLGALTLENQKTYIRFMDYINELLEKLNPKSLSKSVKIPDPIIDELNLLEENAREAHRRFLQDNDLVESSAQPDNDDLIQFRRFLKLNKSLPWLDKTKHIWKTLKLLKHNNLPNEIQEKIRLFDEAIAREVNNYEIVLQEGVRVEDEKLRGSDLNLFEKAHKKKVEALSKSIEGLAEEASNLFETYFHDWSNNFAIKEKWEADIFKKVELAPKKQPSTTAKILGAAPASPFYMEAVELMNRLRRYYDLQSTEIREYFLMQELGDLLREAKVDKAGAAKLNDALTENREFNRLLNEVHSGKTVLNNQAIDEALDKLANRSTDALRTVFIEGQSKILEAGFCDPQSLMQYAKQRTEWEKKEGDKPLPDAVYYDIFLKEADNKKIKATQVVKKAQTELKAMQTLVDADRQDYYKAQSNLGWFKRLFSMFYRNEYEEFKYAEKRLKDSERNYLTQERQVAIARSHLQKASDYKVQLQDLVKRLGALPPQESLIRQKTREPEQFVQEIEMVTLNQEPSQTKPMAQKPKGFDVLAAKAFIQRLEMSLSDLDHHGTFNFKGDFNSMLERLKSDKEAVNKLKMQTKWEYPELYERASKLEERLQIKIDSFALTQDRYEGIARGKARLAELGIFENDHKDTKKHAAENETAKNRRKMR